MGTPVCPNAALSQSLSAHPRGVSAPKVLRVKRATLPHHTGNSCVIDRSRRASSQTSSE
jgi:hypothetical protein